MQILVESLLVDTAIDQTLTAFGLKTLKKGKQLKVLKKVISKKLCMYVYTHQRQRNYSS